MPARTHARAHEQPAFARRGAGDRQRAWATLAAERFNSLRLDAALHAGLPIDVSGVTVDRQCGSGLVTVVLAASGSSAAGRWRMSPTGSFAWLRTATSSA